MTMTRSTSSSAPAALAADIVLVIVFAALGLASHEGAVDPAGLVRVAWPFAVALLAGWLALRVWTDPSAPVRKGLPLWAMTALGGLALRVITGGGAAIPFVVVTAIVLLVFLVGWRLAVHALRSARARRRPSAQ